MSERTYIKNEVILFRSTKEEFGGLSNMAPGFSVRVNGVIINSIEALYQACRYPLFPEIQEAIIKENSPMTAKMISKKHYSYTRQDWENVKYDVMYWCLQVKLSQNYESFSSLLQKTEEKPIVEYSPKDKDWAATSISDTELRGKNALGRLIMKLRKEHIIEQKDIECIDPISIPGFLLYGSSIGTVCNPEDEFESDFHFDLDYELA